jgi:hypothetical protein
LHFVVKLLEFSDAPLHLQVLPEPMLVQRFR